MSRIPKILHYVFLCDSGLPNQKPWSLSHYVCVRSAIERIRPDTVVIHCDREPGGPWWELTRPLVTLARVEAPGEIFGNPLLHPAHQSDVLRLEILQREGGIYLDIDVFVQRDFDDLLDGHSTVMGREGPNGLYGTGNAVVLAEPGAPFLRRWSEEYRWFRGRGREVHWSEHSVEVPGRLAREHPDEVTLLDERAFFWPLWTNEQLGLIFDPQPQDFDARATYANHLWESSAWERYLEHLTPGRVRATDSPFHRWCRPFVADLPDHYGAPSVAQRWTRGKRIGRVKVEQGIVAAKEIASRLLGPRLKAKAKALLHTEAGPLVSELAARALPGVFESWHRRRTFQTVYTRGQWGEQEGSTFFSGVGSRGEVVDRYVDRMAEIIAARGRDLGRSVAVVDLGCGDFEVGRRLLERVPDIAYLGCDIVPELIAHHTARTRDARATFTVLDMVRDPLPDADICLVRQVLQHLSNADIARVLPKLSKYDSVYVSEGHPAVVEGPVNPDKPVGSGVRFDWRTGRGRGVEFDQPPFNLRVEELLRVASTPAENVVTFRVHSPAWSRTAVDA